MRWDPFREMEEMHRRMDDLFSQAFGFSLPEMSMPRAMMTGGNDTEPDVDIYENDTEFVIHAFLPGVNQNDIQVNATENSISLSAETRSPFENENQQTGGAAGAQATQATGSGQQTNATQSSSQNQQGGQTASQNQNTQQGQNAPYTQHRQSRYSRYNRYQFAYTLPEEINPNEVRAQFRNGRLELTLPKMQKAQQAGAVRIPVSGEMQSLPQGTSGNASPSTSASTGTSGTTTQASGNKSQPLPESVGQTHQRGGESMTNEQGSTTNASTQKASKTGADKSS
jgi:HSP20 family molecular chaperone IbpA